MKKVMTMIAVVAVAGSAMAGLTEFNWAGGTAGEVTAGSTVYSLDGANAAALAGPTIDIGVLLGLEIWSQDTVVIAPPFAGSTWGTGQISDPTSDRVGSFAMAFVDADGVLEVGDVLTVTSLSFEALNELDTVPAGLPQTFSPGATTSVTVIPEPATIGLLGIAGLGMFLARRKVRS
jgi:hypothetical protein